MNLTGDCMVYSESEVKIFCFSCKHSSVLFLKFIFFKFKTKFTCVRVTVEHLHFIVVCYQVIYDNYACMKIFDSQFFKTLSANMFLVKIWVRVRIKMS